MKSAVVTLWQTIEHRYRSLGSGQIPSPHSFASNDIGSAYHCRTPSRHTRRALALFKAPGGTMSTEHIGSSTPLQPVHITQSTGGHPSSVPMDVSHSTTSSFFTVYGHFVECYPPAAFANNGPSTEHLPIRATSYKHGIIRSVRRREINGKRIHKAKVGSARGGNKTAEGGIWSWVHQAYTESLLN